MFFSNAIAQATYGVVVLSNCYQRVLGNNNVVKNYKFLKTSLGGNIKFSSTNSSDIESFYVYYDNNGTWEYFDHFYNNSVDPLNMIYDKYKIVPRAFPTSSATPQPVEIEFVDPSVNPEDLITPCLIFDMRGFKININLDGLCFAPLVKLKLPSTAISRWGLNPNWNENLVDGANLKIPISDSFCLDQWFDEWGHFPCRCLNFDFEVTLLPCPGTELSCPELKFIIKKDICCCCGYFDPTRE